MLFYEWHESRGSCGHPRELFQRPLRDRELLIADPGRVGRSRPIVGPWCLEILLLKSDTPLPAEPHMCCKHIVVNREHSLQESINSMVD